MSLTYEQVVAVTEECASTIVEARLVDCAEISKRRFLLRFEKNGVIITVMVCLQDPFLRLHLSKTRFPKKTAEGTGPTAARVLKTFEGQALKALEVLAKDRIVKFGFGKASLIVELFSKKPNLYIVNKGDKILWAYNRTDAVNYKAPTARPERLGDKEVPMSSATIEAFYTEQEASAGFVQEKRRLRDSVRSHLKHAQRFEKKSLKDVERCGAWPELQRDATVLQAYFHLLKPGQEEISLEDWDAGGAKRTIALDPTLEPHEQVEALFRESKKRHKGLEFAEANLAQARHDVEKWEKALAKVDAAESLEGLQSLEGSIPPLSPKQASPEQKRRLPYRTFVSAKGLRILVGRNAADNEKLTFHVAKGNDWWLHTKDYSGSHVVVVVEKGAEPDQESILDAAQLALQYSQAKKNGEADMTVTQRKFVSRIKGKRAGTVAISKHNTLYVKLDPQRLDAIKSRSKL